MSKFGKRLLAAALCLLLTAGGCAAAPPEETWALQETFEPLEDPIFDVLANALSHGGAAPVQAVGREGLVPFGEMVYTRPDAGAIEERLYQIAEAVRASQDAPGAAVLLLKEAGELWDSYLTALNLALIHYDINTTDAYWAEEYAYCSSVEGALRVALAHVQGSAAALQGETAMDASAFDQEQYLSLQAREQSLLSEYNDLRNNAYTIVGDETIYYADDLPFASAMAWLEAFTPRLSEIYAELVGVRNGIARCFGYANYAEYIFADSGYTTTMVRTLLEALETYYAPLYREDLDAYREPDLRVEADQMISFMRTIFSQLDPQLAESLDVMETYQLSSLEATAEKAPGAFTTYLADYGAPFICMCYTGSYGSFTTLLHEFGHFNDMYRNEAAMYETPEISEIFSTALVMLASDRYDLVMDAETAALCKYCEVNEIYLTALEQGALLSLELEAYTMPEGSLSTETLCSLAENAWRDMGLPESPVARVSWMQTPHLYETPFYVLSYIVSGNVALQIWEMDGRDPAAGFAVYNELLTAAMDEDATFLEIVEGCGLASPFAVAEVARQAEVIGAQLATPPELLYGPPEAVPEAQPAAPPPEVAAEAEAPGPEEAAPEVQPADIPVPA